MSKRHLTGLELEKRRLERIRKRAYLKQLRRASASRLEVCQTCGRRHESKTHLQGAVMIPPQSGESEGTATVTPVSNSEKDSEGKVSIDSEKESTPSKTSEESNSTEKDIDEEKEVDEDV